MIIQTAPASAARLAIMMHEHTALSGQFARAFGNERFEPVHPSDPMFYVVAHHDAGWSEFDRNPVTDEKTGLPYNLVETPAEHITVASWSVGLLVDYATEVGAGVLVKGIRSQVDVAYETPMAIVNRHLAGVETVFLLPDPSHALVSSSLVRQVASLGGDVSPYVPPVVSRFLDTGGRGI